MGTGRTLAVVGAGLAMLAAPQGAVAASGSGACNEYSLSCGGPPSGGDGGGGPPVPAGVPSAPTGGTIPTTPTTPGGETRRPQPSVGPTARAQLAAAGHLPFTGYPLTPLIEVLLAMIAAAAAIRLALEIRRRRGGTVQP